MRAAIDSGRLHHAWLLHGPKGLGKAEFAGQVAARLLAEASSTPPGDVTLALALDPEHPTARLISAGSHPDLVVLRRLENEKTGAVARNITVGQTRTLKAVFAGTPSARRPPRNRDRRHRRYGARCRQRAAEEP